MSYDIHNFLLAYDESKNELVVQEDYGTDSEAAIQAYFALEKEHFNNPSMNIVLLGSDSIETVRKTHSTYFPEERRKLRENLLRSRFSASEQSV